MTTLDSALLHTLTQSDFRTVNHRQVRVALKEHLLSLSFHAFEEMIMELLTDLGYSAARLLGRTRWRQCTRHGGTDMEAFINVGLSRSQIVLQVKQYRRPVSRRFIDELCGAILRSGAREGMIITTSNFSNVARKSAQSQSIVPIRLIDGEELTGLLIEHQIGVLSEEYGGNLLIAVNSDYFQELHRRFPNTRHPTLSGSAKPENERLTPEVTLPRIDSFNNSTPMLWRTHALAGINSLWLLYPLPGALTSQTLPLAIIMATLGSLLPDIDAVESKIKNLGVFGITPLVPVSMVVNRSFGHRGILHAPIALIPVAVVSAVLAYWIGIVPGISLLLGYGSHLIMDAMTKSGISRLPFSQKRLHLLPASLRVVTGSIQEDITMFLLALAALPLLLHFLHFV